MRLSAVVHEHGRESRLYLVVESKREIESPLELGVVERYVWTELVLGQTFGERDVICLRTCGRTDSVAAGTKVDHRSIVRLGLGDPVPNEVDFSCIGVPLESRLNAWRKPVGSGVAPARARQIDIYESSAERPFFINLPRTEEATLTGSSGSRGDLESRRLNLGYALWAKQQGDEPSRE